MKKKYYFFGGVGLLLILLCSYLGYKAARKVENIVSKLEILTYSSQMLLAEHFNTNCDTLSHSHSILLRDSLKVTCLGNSITKHPYLPEVEWYSNWGMAASKEEYDYCHVLQKRLREYSKYATVTPVNIAQFERTPTCNLDSLLGHSLAKTDIIVIRLGENVYNIQSFEDNIQRLIDKCKSYTPYVIITGNFWMHPQKERILINAAYNNNLRFVPLSWIAECKNAYPQKGDTIYNIDGKPYILTKEFVLTHPNNQGMKSIANAIFNAITYFHYSK